jgi:hypothetical protein
MNKATTQFWRKLYYDLANEVEQVLGKALGYPKYSDDQKNFPGTTEADGVCVGEHVPESLLSEAAGKLKAPKFYWTPQTFPQFDWQYRYPAMFGGYYNTNNGINGIDIKPLILDKAAETPCTAEIEVAFEKLAAYFEKRAKENSRRAEKEDNSSKNLLWYHDMVGADRSGYYFSGKADSYKRAAEKVREILGK